MWRDEFKVGFSVQVKLKGNTVGLYLVGCMVEVSTELTWAAC
jgi:hypothetical protein